MSLAQAALLHLKRPAAADDLRAVFESQRAASREGGAPDYASRRESLDALLRAVLARQEEFVQAISSDFGGRSREETLLLEVFPLVSQLRHARRRLKGWMRERRACVGWQFLPARARVVYQPLGVVGVVSAWNYPLYLSLSPVVCALAAGNRVMLKPSEYAPRTAGLLQRMLGETFPAGQVTVVTGDAEVSADFCSLPFDHLLFTGSTSTGKLVLKAAAENLTPVTLELGGKSPAIIHPGYPPGLAAERIMTGKLYNAGQTCVAPDYVLVHEGARDEFIERAAAFAAKLYPSLADNGDYTRVINGRHYARLDSLVADALAHGAEVVRVNPRGERCDAGNRIFPPTIVSGCTDEMALMREEVFGPVLPVVTYRTPEEALRYVNQRPRPLALYYFDSDGQRVAEVVRRTVSGGVTVNDVLLHLVQNDLPFGGVGPSGMGQYHGFDGFETFSKKKGVMSQGRFSAGGLFRPPYTGRTLRLIKLLIGWRGPRG